MSVDWLPEVRSVFVRVRDSRHMRACRISAPGAVFVPLRSLRNGAQRRKQLDWYLQAQLRHLVIVNLSKLLVITLSVSHFPHL